MKWAQRAWPTPFILTGYISRAASGYSNEPVDDLERLSYLSDVAGGGSGTSFIEVTSVDGPVYGVLQVGDYIARRELSPVGAMDVVRMKPILMAWEDGPCVSAAADAAVQCGESIKKSKWLVRRYERGFIITDPGGRGTVVSTKSKPVRMTLIGCSDASARPWWDRERRANMLGAKIMHHCLWDLAPHGGTTTEVDFEKIAHKVHSATQIFLSVDAHAHAPDIRVKRSFGHKWWDKLERTFEEIRNPPIRPDDIRSGKMLLTVAQLSRALEYASWDEWPTHDPIAKLHCGGMRYVG